MSLAGRVLSELEDGEWTLKSIAPSFQRRLQAEAIGVKSEKNLSELCLGYYAKTNLDLISIPAKKNEIDLNSLSQNSRDAIQNILRNEYPESELIAFESEISLKLQNAIKLIHEIDPQLW